MTRLSQLEQRIAEAPAPVRDRAETLIVQLERLVSQAKDDEVWGEQIGAAYTTGQVAELLDVTKQAVAKRRGLLRLVQRDGQTVYPVLQFDGDRPVPGLGEVVAELMPYVATPWTIASWLASHQASVGGRRPIDALRRGDVAPTVQAARQFAAALDC